MAFKCVTDNFRIRVQEYITKYITINLGEYVWAAPLKLSVTPHRIYQNVFISETDKNTMNEKKQYSSPEIVFETDLETKAGSPLGIPDSDLTLPGLEDQ